MYYQIFLDGDYVTDALGYIAGEVRDDEDLIPCLSEGWRDVNNKDMLLMSGYSSDLSELRKKVKRFYPDIDLRVLKVFAYKDRGTFVGF